LGGADLGLTGDANLPTLVVCRSSAEGLIAAQRLAAGELSGVPSWHCLGLVVVADDRHPLPKALVELAALVTAGYAQHWPIPWMESWRTPPILTQPTPIPIQPMTAESTTRPKPRGPAHAAPRRFGRHPRRTNKGTKEQP
jgi:hypothetical protein